MVAAARLPRAEKHAAECCRTIGVQGGPADAEGACACAENDGDLRGRLLAQPEPHRVSGNYMLFLFCVRHDHDELGLSLPEPWSTWLSEAPTILLCSLHAPSLCRQLGRKITTPSWTSSGERASLPMCWAAPFSLAEKGFFRLMAVFIRDAQALRNYALCLQFLREIIPRRRPSI